MPVFRSLHCDVNIDKGKFTDMISTDLQKTFDTIDHGICLDRIKFYGISDMKRDWFPSHLNSRNQFCKGSGVSSDIKGNGVSSDIGVPQGLV